MTSDRRPKVDRNECFSYARCIETLPDVFFLDEDEKAAVRDIDAPEESLREAVDNCPMGAIALIDGSGQVIYP